MRFEAAKAIAQQRCWGACEGCGTGGAPLDPHHRMTRGSGGVHGAAADVSNHPSNLLMLCRPCHDHATNDITECIKVGWVIERRAGVNPQEIPAKIYTVNGRGWWFLLEDGTYRWDDTANLNPFHQLNYKADA